MEAPHMLAAISRAKTLARDSNIQISDDVIGYLCKCADVSGSWWDMLGMPTAVSPAHAADREDGPAVADPRPGVDSDAGATEARQSAGAHSGTSEADEDVEPLSAAGSTSRPLGDAAGAATSEGDDPAATPTDTEAAPTDAEAQPVEAPDAAHTVAQEPAAAEAGNGAEPESPSQEAAAEEAAEPAAGASREGGGEGEGDEALAASASGVERTGASQPDEGANQGGDAEAEAGADDNAADLVGPHSGQVSANGGEGAGGAGGDETPAGIAPTPEHAGEESITAVATGAASSEAGSAAAEPREETSELLDVHVVVDAIEQLAAHVVAELSKPDSPAVMVAKLQLAMEHSFQAQRRQMQGQQEERVERITAKMRQVLGFRKPNSTVQEMNRLYDQVVYFTCMAACMDAGLSDAAAEAEVRAAVDSVFPFSMLAQFLTLSEKDREQQLNELPYIVLGICVYNHASGSGAGAALPLRFASLPDGGLRIVESEGDSGATRVAVCNEHAHSIRVALPGYTGVLADALHADLSSTDRVQRLHAEALFLFQMHTHLQQLIMAFGAAFDSLDQLQGELAGVVTQITGMISQGHAVPKQDIMPLFHRMGQLYETLVDERQSVGMNSQLLDTLVAQRAGMHPTISPIGLKQAATSPCIHMFATTGTTPSGLVPAASGAAPIHLHAADIAGLELPPLAYGGADVVALARHSGLPAVAAPGMDYVLYPETDGSIYGFSCHTTLEAFLQQPDEYIAAARQVLTAQPHLIPIFGTTDASLPRFVSDVADIAYSTIKCNYGTQTPTHFVERHIDQTYEWNEWVLRRRAVKLANLRTKITRGAQTIRSTFRRENETQYYQARKSSTQTAVNKGQSMPKKLRYIAGIRGDPVTVKMNVVALELDIGQPHQL